MTKLSVRMTEVSGREIGPAENKMHQEDKLAQWLQSRMRFEASKTGFYGPTSTITKSITALVIDVIRPLKAGRLIKAKRGEAMRSHAA